MFHEVLQPCRLEDAIVSAADAGVDEEELLAAFAALEGMTGLQTITCM